ncbi:uncharacterized protein NECHADRAFT_50617 [Fusarium vanettenii 77-13-4]|uniref:DUF4238 domain-containing protein n=1 Tax=Fusarium vanettenii (strain ATCC MYA-4622 / CBS 123669 / FGSC 9596 / NRRL 45880 / 77-13-4) TaxID=660122 RepID=C7Z1X0_FUSV7|nr:uncharacterized protein NECHADRAFT_50617 [Fusarium vanettenii 77-13-4]EEU42072.1 hypothetical protein NECHADRAFT_50617 [Fusarium vanettenii 77-13-4]
MSSANKEYQHFIPQFLLRNYSHPFVCPQAKGSSKKCKKHKHEKGKYPGDPVVSNLCLTAEPYTLKETPVARVFGQLDMYEYMTTSPDKKHRRIEEMLGKMEFEASKIFRRITTAYGKGQPDVWLSRTERNLLRKFFFLLKYRGSDFHRRFYHSDLENYDRPDKKLLQDYMEMRGFKTPLDVWFHNLETIMELDLGTDSTWETTIWSRMFYADAGWLISHIDSFYMAICTPANPDEEFILSDNCYNIFEGPNMFMEDVDTGERACSGHASFHEFAPLSPRLIIVLRSICLPVPEEDKNPVVREWRKLMRKEIYDILCGPGTESMLQDLPVTKARNSNIDVINGECVPKPGWSGQYCKDDRFFFKFFPLETRHVQMINGVLLDNCYSCSRIAFGSQDAFLKTLGWWLADDCTAGKIFQGEIDQDRLKYLSNLEAFMKTMGWDKRLVYMQLPATPVRGMKSLQDRNIESRRALYGMILGPEAYQAPFPKVMKPYEKLGGTWRTVFYDTTQSELMLKLRIKIDVWSQGVDETIRHRNRLLLTEEYMNLPCHRFWMYLKYCRFLFLTGGGPVDRDIEEVFQDGLEDRFTECEFFAWWPRGGD